MAVARLNELTQKQRLVVRYEDVGSVGPDHIKTFTVRAVVDGKPYPDGVGKNKKEAKLNAAENALTVLLEETIDPTENATEASTASAAQTVLSQGNYMCWLNEYSQKNRMMIRAVESTQLVPNGLSPCCCCFVVGGKEYPRATGKTKKEAKEEAAKLVFQQIHGIETTENIEEEYCGTPSKESKELNMSDICDKMKSMSVLTKEKAFKETNFIKIVKHHCHKTKLFHDYVLEERMGPDQSPQFFCKLVIDNRNYPLGEGKNVEEAKQNAARLAWSALTEQTDRDSKLSPGSAVSKDGLFASSDKPEFLDPKSERVSTAASDSALFTNSSDPPVDQIKSPDVKPKIRIAANFQNACRNSKEGEMPNFSGKSPGRSPSKKTTTQPSASWFTSEFDSIESLGKGSFGHVFKAENKLLRKSFAIKIVRCKDVKKALGEVKVLSDLNHCNIVRYYSCWLEDSGYQWDSAEDSSSSSRSNGSSSVKYLYIQMELCSTRTLRVWIDEKNLQNVKKSLRDSKRREESLTIVQQIVSAVEYIHSKMLIHRDLKPANLLFGQDGEVKIGDFGLVTEENNDDAENILERTVYKGTPCYMAPEQKSRSSTYDRKVDIFAFGLLYFELLWNISIGQERKKVMDDARNQIFPERFSSNFILEVKVIKSMLSANPEDRPEASQLKMHLEECSQTLRGLKDTRRESRTF
ncbi:interferon-induced, double-stranded RNA-activated protein kinase [Gasterosteus aculeatus]